jgi:hypothetical protein
LYLKWRKKRKTNRRSHHFAMLWINQIGRSLMKDV